MSLRLIAKQLGITPAYLSYMVNGKRPWRRDLFERYSYLVNTSVNTHGTEVNNIARSEGTELPLSLAMTQLWREREGVEPTVDTVGCPPSDLKSAKPTRAHPLP